jgi:hypothetical protein
MRDPKQLDQVPLEDEAAREESRAKAPPPKARAKAVAEPKAVSLNYPEPTPLATIVRDIARWAELSFVMEPSTNVKIQIFAAPRLDVDAAWELFLASLSVVGLRAVQVGRVVKIVPITGVIAA